MSDAWIPLLSALISGVVVKVVDHTFHGRARAFEDAVSIRRELRDEVHALHRELKTLQQELDRWKERYYSLVVQCQSLREALEELREHDDLRGYQQFQRALSDMRDSAKEVDHGFQASSEAPSGPPDTAVPPDVS